MSVHPEPLVQMNMLSTTITVCSKCILSKTRINVVIGSGKIPNQIVFIGEAPGSQEDKQGIPFVGRAGKIFDRLLNSISLTRNEVYITNILKCRPPKNRNPKTTEIIQCTPYLEKQIEILRPKILAPMGTFPTKYCCSKFNIPFDNISSIHGKKFLVTGTSFSGFIMPLYHPAAAIYNPYLSELMKKDMQGIKNQLIQYF